MNVEHTILAVQYCKTAMFYVTPNYAGMRSGKFLVVKVDDDDTEHSICSFQDLKMAHRYIRWVCKFRDHKTRLTFHEWLHQRTLP